ncbi:MFS transporter [Methylobacterium sp. 13MFTsu3.1M2]|uniref:MFS transporter n=1 Tax=Methylobacterium sp. 13MFTsu3.1M2 TaxID=1502776 RepID=UPI0008EDC74E|nr:MFS transporter [Methylobacterium sp. 13MFTsu3.1M2]SFF16584.1 MFS transporter, MHS family, proline/betaine transporter [Methylobacterium sp. 13MFTsu3.1M2]
MQSTPPYGEPPLPISPGAIADGPKVPGAARRRSVVAGAIGNTLEWYDFATYGYFSAVIGRNFFPSDSPTTSLLSAFAVFAAAFFMRPIGGVVFGHIGDRYGRKTALLLSAGLMAVSTFLMGCLPTYASAGLLAPVLLVVLRLGQGLSVGGEYTSSAIFLSETAAPARRGLTGSLACIGAAGGILLGSIAGTLVTGLLTPEDVHQWGWRLPFLFGIVLGVFIFALRRHIDDDHVETVFREDRAPTDQRSPLRTAVAIDGSAMLRAFAMNLGLACGFYVVFVYLVTFMHTVSGLPQHTAFLINSLAMVVQAVCIPIAGALSDRFGRKRVLVLTGAGLTILSWPLFMLLTTGDTLLIVLSQVAFAILIAGNAAVVPTAFVEMFQHRSRCTALAISFNASMALVGGTAPMAATWIVHHLAWPTGPGLYVAVLSAISLAAVLTMRDRTGESLA